jgi:hypothetical protein
MNPSKNITSNTKISAVYAPPGSELKIRLINSSPPTPLKINENIEAPIRIVKIIVDTTAVFSEVSLINLRLIFPFINAITKAPKAPIAEASVGVAIPANIEPNTKKIKVIGRASVLNISIFLI